MAQLGIFLPTYHRPHKLADVARNIEETTYSDFVLYFGCEADDIESQEAAINTGHRMIINQYDSEHGYSNTIQTIYENSTEPIFFHANDDLEFFHHWDKLQMEYLDNHHDIMVLGASDGTDGVSYSTICFIRRQYIEELSGVMDMANRVFYPYHHNYQDTEFTRTARYRDVWAKLEVPCIKHHRTNDDPVYEKNNATSPKDGITFDQRKHLWEDHD